MTNQEQTFVSKRLINRQSGGVGAAIPPTQAGNVQALDATNLRITNTTVNLDGSNTFTLAFTEPISITYKIDHYNIYVTTPQQNMIVMTQHSPVLIKVVTAGVQTVSFKVQTVLAGGLHASIS